MHYSVFALPDTETDTETDKKMVCVELCVCGVGVGVHTAQRPTPTQVPVGFCTDFINISVGLCFGVWQCERTIKATFTDQQCFELLSDFFGL